MSKCGLNLVKLSVHGRITTLKEMKKLLILSAFLLFSFSLRAQSDSLKEFVGVYTFQNAPFDRVVITHENGVLTADAEGVGKGEIAATHVADEFSEPNYQALLTFKRDGSGKITGLVIEARGDRFEGVKEVVGLEEYAGTYSLEGSAEVTEVVISVRDGALYIEASIGGSFLMTTDVKDSFQLGQVMGGVLFKRDAAGKVNGIEVDYSGNIFKGSRK